MEKIFAKVEELTGNIKEYVDSKIDHTKLTAAERASSIAANTITIVAVGVVLLFFLVFASTALALLLGKWIGSNWAGFLIVAGMYLLIAVIVWTGREKWIRMRVINALINQLFRNQDDED